MTMVLCVCAVAMLISSIWMGCDKKCDNFKGLTYLCMAFSMFMLFAGVQGG